MAGTSGSSTEGSEPDGSTRGISVSAELTPLAIVATGLRRTYGDVVAVDSVDLSVTEGEIYGFLGPNGAGKSTVVKMLTTLITPSGGSCTVLGHDVVTGAGQIRLQIGVALQEASLDKKQTGRELLRLQARLYGLTKAEADRRIAELSSLIEMDAIDRFVETYSGGMERRLDLAASLMHNPRLLFLDEPTTGLDLTSRTFVWDEVRRLNAELGTTIFLTTQYLEEADELADRVGIISDGRLVGQGSPDELKRQVGTDVIVVKVASDLASAARAVSAVSQVEHVETAGDELLISVSDGAQAVSPVAVALDASGAVVSQLTMRSPTLDDVFFELTGGRIEVDA